MQSFAQLGTKSGEYWQRGFTIRFPQDAGIDWGALTKTWANMLAEDMLRPDSGLFMPALTPGGSDDVAITNGYLMPDW